ncbi:LacI family DNA-binding transcriptional regulator [Clostridium ganghwense]|uniref:LacI family DNA-binding transcriptional regulator n=1 Tax=Clostridium ganghwense TaxID=312089 RepID=A0ABT4CPX6_9CLOT|nr:LacI family DNA-binding transcriptional regulator [Clostridium ganghwense]MCY6370286.1 LacI family DNA-binding transcriptional regulator [Clostridium ganghwense]
MVTIKEIAKKAGVAPSTVSRVISDDSRISDATKEKVRKIMKDMSYHPNAIARSLVSKATKTIGIIMPNSAEKSLLNPFFPEALRGITKALYNRKYNILLTGGETKEEQIVSMHSLVRGRMVDGIILMYTSVDDPILAELRKMNISFSVIGRPVDDSDIIYVDNDNVKAAYDAMIYLINQGHRRIGLINGSMNLLVSVDRYEGYKKALIENSIDIDENMVISSEFIEKGGYEGMKKILSAKNPPTSVLITDDIMALGAIKAASEMNVKIPEDISIISFNNFYISQLTAPPLTSIDINIYNLGFYAAELLLKKINGKGKFNDRKKIVETEIIHRDSVIERNF